MWMPRRGSTQFARLKPVKWNVDYLANTVARLDDMGIAEGHLHALLRRVTEIRGER